MSNKNYEKLNISLPLELHSWVVNRQKEEQAKLRFGRFPLSRVIAEAVDRMMQEEASVLREGNDNPRPHAGGEILKPHNRPAGGSKTPKTVTYRKTGRARK